MSDVVVMADERPRLSDAELLEVARGAASGWDPFSRNHDPQFLSALRDAFASGFQHGYRYHETFGANCRLIAAAPELLAALKEMGDWIAGGLQASDEAWPDAKCLQHTEEIAARARAAVDKAEGRS